jgi:uroporphyrinogen III methyltransferase/synthase
VTAGPLVILTRPEGQAAGLPARLAAAGLECLHLPLFRILPVADTAPLDAVLARLGEFDLAVFVSPNAVRQTADRLPAGWPPQVPIGIVGPASEEAVRAVGWQAPTVAPAERFDSEGLYAALQAQALAPRRVLILRGNGGRDWLQERLAADGAMVELAECYRREPLALDGAADRLRGLARAQAAAVLVLTSSEAARHLANEARRLAVDAWLLGQAVLATHARIAETARLLGFSDVRSCAPGDEGIARALESTR